MPNHGCSRGAVSERPGTLDQYQTRLPSVEDAAASDTSCAQEDLAVHAEHPAVQRSSAVFVADAIDGVGLREALVPVLAGVAAGHGRHYVSRRSGRRRDRPDRDGGRP